MTKDIVEQVNKIKGWFTLEEMEALSSYVPENGLIVELGSYHGRSTMFFRLISKAIIIAIDVCTPYDGFDIPKSIDKAVLDKGNIFQIAGDNHEVVTRWNLPIDFLFIDTKHTYSDTIDTLNEWSKYVNGYIALHDYHTEFSGVVEAVTVFMSQHKEMELISLPVGIALIKTK